MCNFLSKPSTKFCFKLLFCLFCSFRLRLETLFAFHWLDTTLESTAKASPFFGSCSRTAVRYYRWVRGGDTADALRMGFAGIRSALKEVEKLKAHELLLFQKRWIAECTASIGDDDTNRCMHGRNFVVKCGGDNLM